jgi:hypothetical protein
MIATSIWKVGMMMTKKMRVIWKMMNTILMTTSCPFEMSWNHILEWNDP